MNYTRNSNGIAVLADHGKMQEYIDKNKDRETIESLQNEINKLKKELQEIKFSISNQQKSE